ncbi:hypothetical protein AK812_SmicGene12848 [Symbiodinium microadriaticum]|uniref:Uncharacterized protein n=1 Tax=Symbiodinium microadriaticum TaxID=2951 RepID=A0A1Q9E9N9_SYMMI|nr:hypothetical protein AK812_SmicGene12848 [Symbiodinium microadriaticum]
MSASLWLVSSTASCYVRGKVVPVMERRGCSFKEAVNILHPPPPPSGEDNEKLRIDTTKEELKDKTNPSPSAEPDVESKAPPKLVEEAASSSPEKKVETASTEKKDLDKNNEIQEPKVAPQLHKIKYDSVSELQLPGVCPCAVVVAAAVQLGIEAYNIEHGALHTNYDHVTAFHRTGVLDRTIMNASAICSVAEGRFWPIARAVDVLLTTKRSMMERLQRVGDWVATFQEEPTITDEQHIEALADAAVVFDSEGLEWWPCRGTLIALLRHGKRSGVLSKGKLDVVDHDVDIMVCVSSHEKWAEQRLSVEKKLQERGWSHCFERYSASESHEGHQYHFARGDLWLCTRTDPKVTLDIATYIIDGPIAYAQQYCLPSSHSALRSRCWFPQNDGTFRGSRGRLRVSAIRPLKRCKAGHLSVPCPREPLETLRATMNVNFTGSCVALPDIEQRLERDLYDSDKDAWLSEGLTKEDVEILRQRAAVTASLPMEVSPRDAVTARNAETSQMEQKSESSGHRRKDSKAAGRSSSEPPTPKKEKAWARDRQEDAQNNPSPKRDRRPSASIAIQTEEAIPQSSQTQEVTASEKPKKVGTFVGAGKRVTQMSQPLLGANSTTQTKGQRQKEKKAKQEADMVAKYEDCEPQVGAHPGGDQAGAPGSGVRTDGVLAITGVAGRGQPDLTRLRKLDRRQPERLATSETSLGKPHVLQEMADLLGMGLGQTRGQRQRRPLQRRRLRIDLYPPIMRKIEALPLDEKLLHYPIRHQNVLEAGAALGMMHGGWAHRRYWTAAVRRWNKNTDVPLFRRGEKVLRSLGWELQADMEHITEDELGRDTYLEKILAVIDAKAGVREDDEKRRAFKAVMTENQRKREESLSQYSLRRLRDFQRAMSFGFDLPPELKPAMLREGASLSEQNMQNLAAILRQEDKDPDKVAKALCHLDVRSDRLIGYVDDGRIEADASAPTYVTEETDEAEDDELSDDAVLEELGALDLYEDQVCEVFAVLDGNGAFKK